MQKAVSLAKYVKKRNGVAIGASGSMKNMFQRALGAGSFTQFWHYWNPVWGYYLSRNVMKPASSFLPVWLAVLITFAVSGGLHDIAVSVVKWQFILFFTPWFVFMGLMVVVTKYLDLTYGGLPWGVKAVINSAFIGVCLAATYLLESFYM